MSAFPVDDSIFGPMVDRGSVEQGVLTHLQKWFLNYLAWIERSKGLDPQALVQPQSWDIVSQFTRFPEDSLPWVAVISTGINSGRPIQRDGDGNVSAWWLVAVGAICAASTALAAKELAGYYGVAIRNIMSQLPDLSGWAMGTEWEDERYDDTIGRLQERNLAGVREVFSVQVPGVMNVMKGPTGNVVPPDPYQPPESYPPVGQGKVSVEVTEET